VRETRSPETQKLKPWAPSWWAQDARWLSLLVPATIFAGCLAGGAIAPKTGLTLAMACALLLLGALAAPRVRNDLAGLRVGWPAAFFGLTVLAVLWSLTPFAPGGPHPVWLQVGISPGASTIDKSQTLLELIKLLGLGVIFLLGCILGRNERRARTAFRVVLALGAGLGLWAFLAFAGGRIVGPRLSASFGAPNTAATVFALLLVLAVGVGVSRRGATTNARLIAAAPVAAAGLVFAACLLATASRGGVIAASAGLAALAVLHTLLGQTRWTRATLAVAAGLVGAATLLAFAGTELIDRLGAVTWEVAGRRTIFEAHWRAFQDFPWMGYGLGSFDAVNRMLLSPADVQDLWSIRAAHNIYLGWLEQAGVVGATPMFLTVGAIVAVTLLRTARRSRFRNHLFALLAADVVVLVHGASDFALETYAVAGLWSLLLGLQFAAAQGFER